MSLQELFLRQNGFLLRKAVQDAQTFLGPKNKKFCGPFDMVGSVLKVRYKQKIAFLGDFLAWGAWAQMSLQKLFFKSKMAFYIARLYSTIYGFSVDFEAISSNFGPSWGLV